MLCVSSRRRHSTRGAWDEAGKDRSLRVRVPEVGTEGFSVAWVEETIGEKIWRWRLWVVKSFQGGCAWALAPELWESSGRGGWVRGSVRGTAAGGV